MVLLSRFFPKIAPSNLKASRPKLNLSWDKILEQDENDIKTAHSTPMDYLNSTKTPHATPVDSLISYDTTIRQLAKSTQNRKIISLIESYKEDPRITQEHFFSTLIRSYGIARMSVHANRLYEKMENFGTPRSSISFNALLSVYIACKKFEAVSKLFDEIPKKYGFSPDKISYTLLIKSYTELDMFDSAIFVLEYMERNNVEITCTCYAPILDALYKKSRSYEARKVWKRMVEKGCSPDVVVYNTRIIHAQNPEYILALLKEMTAAGIKPNTVSYNYLFKSYCLKDRISEACKVLHDFGEYGCTPDKTTYRMAIDYLSRSGYFKEAYEILKENIDMGGTPPFQILRALVQGLANNSMEEEAEVVVRSLKEKFPDTFYNTSKWKKLELAVGRR